MASKKQQYELLAQSVDQRPVPNDLAARPVQGQSDVSELPTRAQLYNGFPDHVIQAIRPSRATFFWIIISHMIVTGILIATIVLGATLRTYAISDQAKFLGMTLSVDNQMFFYGIFNKMADYVLNDSIGRISGVLLTVWMSGTTRYPGVLPIDFELSEEMSKPWRAVFNAIHRWKLDPPRKKPIAITRAVVTFATGWTVLLLGGSFNVVAMPKLRWTGTSFADGTSIGIRVEVPTKRIDNVNWSNLDIAYSEIFAGEINASSRSTLGDTLAGTTLLDMLTDLSRSINIGSGTESDIGVGKPGFTNLYTIQRARTVRFGVDFIEPKLAAPGRGFTNANLSTESSLLTLSVQEGPIYDFWTNANHTDYATKALGARNWFNLTLPILTTACLETNNISVQGSGLSAPETSSSSFAISISGNSPPGGMQCIVSVRQAIVPVYIYNSTNDARDELNTPLADLEANIKYLPFDAQNAAIASSIAARLNATVPYLEQSTGASFDGILTTFAAYLSKNTNGTYVGSSSAAMNYVVGSLAQHLITIATWEESDSDQRHIVGPIQFQLYGSGPRENWQWAIALVLGLAVVVLAYDIFLLAYRRITPGPWLSVPGMMLAANSASSLKVRGEENNSAWKTGQLSKEVERTKYCFASGSDGLVEISRLDARRRARYPL